MSKIKIEIPDIDLLKPFEVVNIEKKLKKDIEGFNNTQGSFEERFLSFAKNNPAITERLMFGYSLDHGDSTKCTSCGISLGRVMPEDSTHDELLCNNCYEQEENQ